VEYDVIVGVGQFLLIFVALQLTEMSMGTISADVMTVSKKV
jgi:hypothetical protein